jgi:hypothetical protein
MEHIYQWPRIYTSIYKYFIHLASSLLLAGFLYIYTQVAILFTATQ